MFYELIPNILAFITVILYALTLIPGIVHTVAKQFSGNKIVKLLTRYRRQLGIFTFIFGLSHGIAILVVAKVNFSDTGIYLKYFQGLLLLLILFLLAITSNNWSVRHLKSNWKRIHQLTYLVVFLTIWHTIDKMQSGWSIFTPIILFVCLFLISLFTERKFLNYLHNHHSQESV